MFAPVGPIPTLWSGDGPVAALHLAADLLAECRPKYVQVHTGEPRLVAAPLRQLLPSVQLIVGVGVDGTAREVASGRKSVAWGVEHLVSFARAAMDVGAEAIVWNAEGCWKTPPNSEQRTRLSAVVRGALNEVHETMLGLAQWHTSYDHPSFHSTYNWSDWIGPGSPVVVSLPQVYAAGEGLAMAHRGALPWREAQALASWLAVVKAGWIRADIADGQPGDETDVDWRPYYQLHHVDAFDTVTCALQHPFAALWAIPSRCDRAGRNALRALCAMDRASDWLPGLEKHNGRTVATAVRLRQRALGVTDDGVYGAGTAKADGIAWEAA
jgi:hypothetical protein